MPWMMRCTKQFRRICQKYRTYLRCLISAPAGPESVVPEVDVVEGFATEVYNQTEVLTNPNPIGLQEATQPEFRPVLVDPNYVWRNDMFSKVAAGKAFREFVLHRAPGSYFDAP